MKKELSKKNNEPKVPVREKILTTAIRLFNEVGVHKTGIDRIISESGVAKKSFYNHFPSKNKLIAEYFNYREELWYNRLIAYSSNPKASPLEQILGFFDALEEWFSEPDFYGCSFIRALSDFEEGDDEELLCCIDNHFQRTQHLLEEKLKVLRPLDYADFIIQIYSLIAGATILAQVTKSSAPALVNKKMARTLLTIS